MRMKTTNFLVSCILAFIMIPGFVLSQDLPVVKANSTSVDVRDGDHFQKGHWQILPEVKPDTYFANRVKKERKIVFYTDIDSISFVVSPGNHYDFIILYRGDSCYTRISTISSQKNEFYKTCSNCQDQPDTIPFRLGRDGKMYIKGSINGSETLNLMFDTGSDRHIISKSGLDKAKVIFSGTEESLGFGGQATRQSSEGNRLQLGNLAWDSISLLAIDKADGDGIIGYPAFDKKIVEINYDNGLIIIHAALPRMDKTYARLPLHFRGGLSFFQASLLTGTKACTGLFEYDTGSNGSLWINQAYAKEQGLYDIMKKLGQTKSRGMGEYVIRNEKVILPEMKLGEFSLKNVPIDLELPSDKESLGWGIFGMDILKRFNTMIDYQNDVIYMQPNSLINDPYKRPFSPYLILLIGGLLLAALGGFYFYWKKRRKNKMRINL
jgi:hypothetical protein